MQQGSYTYTAPDGSIISTSYTADEGGFRVEGSHLPTPPPIPEEIQKGLNQIYEGIRQQQVLTLKLFYVSRKSRIIDLIGNNKLKKFDAF